MIEVEQWDDIDFRHAEVMVDVLILGVSDDLGVSHGIFFFLVDSRVQRRDVHVFDFFLYGLVCFVVEGGGIRSTPEEGITRIHGFHKFELGEECMEREVHFHFTVPVTFLLLYHHVVQGF